MKPKMGIFKKGKARKQKGGDDDEGAQLNVIKEKEAVVEDDNGAGEDLSGSLDAQFSDYDVDQVLGDEDDEYDDDESEAQIQAYSMGDSFVDEKATEVLEDRLYVGDRFDGLRVTMSNPLGFTHVLNCSASAKYPEEDIVYQHLPLSDSGKDDLAHYLPKAWEFLVDALSQPGSKVLVHCNLGRNRGPTIVISYLIKFEGWSFEEAFDHLAAKRPDIQPHPRYEETLRALSENPESFPKA